MLNYRKINLFFHKIANWEYWPFQIVYIPIYFLWAFYSIKSKSLFFFNASNPSIRNGGFFMESKKEIYDLIPQEYYPKTILIKAKTSWEFTVKEIEESKLDFPLIVKPDIGLRGAAVKKINSIEDLKTYSEKANFDYLVQNLIPYKNEIGVFYIRFPNESNGKITGIVAKEFLIVIGDGTSTIEELVKKTPRFELQLDVLKKEYKEVMYLVLKKGEHKNLVPYGNHARGAKFLDITQKNTEKLEFVFNKICRQIDQFYFGRLDVMYNSFEELENGKNFAIVELNGAGSEPTHIYDPKHSLFFAWKTIAQHITYMYKISVDNNKKGVSFLPHKTGMEQYKLHLKQSKKIISF